MATHAEQVAELTQTVEALKTAQTAENGRVTEAITQLNTQIDNLRQNQAIDISTHIAALKEVTSKLESTLPGVPTT